MRFMQIESVLQTKNQSEPAKKRFSVALQSTSCSQLQIPTGWQQLTNNGCTEHFRSLNLPKLTIMSKLGKTFTGC